MPRRVSGASTPLPKLDVESFNTKHIAGNARPGTKIAAHNSSRSTKDSMIEVGADGHFDVQMKSKKGDTIELQLQPPGASTTSSIFIRNDGQDA